MGQVRYDCRDTGEGIVITCKKTEKVFYVKPGEVLEAPLHEVEINSAHRYFDVDLKVFEDETRKHVMDNSDYVLWRDNTYMDKATIEKVGPVIKEGVTAMNKPPLDFNLPKYREVV